jgi:hypothetical protein
MKTLFAIVVAAAALLVAPAPAHADVCGAAAAAQDATGCVVFGPDVMVGPGIELSPGVVPPVASPEDAAAQAASGRPPCVTGDGVPYYTPADMPC